MQEFMQEDMEIDDDEMDEESDEEENVERSFNFVSELAVLVDYDVIEKYIYILKHDNQYTKKPQLIQACSSFFKRIMHQTKQTWIFFQIETLSVMNAFLQKDLTNNSLMRGIQDKIATTTNERALAVHNVEMKQIIKEIAGKFTELLKKNKMLGVEILFRWPSREIKDQILNNYERGNYAGASGTQNKNPRKPEIEEGVVDLDNFDHMEAQLNIENLVDGEENANPEEAEVKTGFQWT